MDIILSKSTWPIIGWVCEILGWLINGIYVLLEAIGIPNIGIAIILFTIVIYALLTPTQIKQQKWSKMMTVIQPELQQIQKKYANKKDQASQMKMNEETMALYQKYGVSPTGSCLPSADADSYVPVSGYLLYSGICGKRKEYLQLTGGSDHECEQLFRYFENVR